MITPHIFCKSILMQKTLETFFTKNHTSYKKANVIIADRLVKTKKPLIVVGFHPKADLKSPITKTNLILECERKLRKSNNQMSKQIAQIDEEINTLTSQFTQKLSKLITKKQHIKHAINKN